MQRLTRDAAAVASATASSLPDETASEDVHPSKAYGGLWSRRDIAHTVEFRPLEPTAVAEAMEYGYLARVQWNAAAGVITLRYQPLGVTVTIQGIGLFDLKERLRQHLVTWIQEQGGDPIQIQAGRQGLGREFIWVQRIRVEEQPATE
ncbi:MAG: hypothetical protein HY040_07560 [Planctomycetes bacterium]|nr:hypothetical protein [Planctomycetota bacterium]